ncbi:hypothetical protein B0H63DRAFT_244960 [Podospora didyma]|uniref:Uncharacterized protein n=1 Tax=Podospora didyma TaxID=330526 RepID=A0AAE0NBX8_9PEZI|nr:hypothetical protein B0H63DRAFT_244960 [Podospora didyma]
MQSRRRVGDRACLRWTDSSSSPVCCKKPAQLLTQTFNSRAPFAAHAITLQEHERENRLMSRRTSSLDARFYWPQLGLLRGGSFALWLGSVMSNIGDSTVSGTCWPGRGPAKPLSRPSSGIARTSGVGWPSILVFGAETALTASCGLKLWTHRQRVCEARRLTNADWQPKRPRYAEVSWTSATSPPSSTRSGEK